MSLSDVMSAAGLSSWTEVALVLCFLAFAAIVVWVFVVRSRPSYDHLREMPLNDDSSDGDPTTSKGDDLP